LNARIRREKQEIKPSFWGKWFGSGQSHPQMGWALAAITLLVVFLFLIPSFASSTSSTTATALTTTLNMFVVVVLAGIILVVLWVMRRK